MIVRVEPDTDVAGFVTRHGAWELASIPSRNIHLLQIPQGIAEDDYAEALKAADEAVAWAEPNGIDQAPRAARPTSFSAPKPVPSRPARPTTPICSTWPVWWGAPSERARSWR